MLKALFRAGGAEYAERDYAIVCLHERAIRHILDRMDLVKREGLVSVAENSGDEIEFVSVLDFESEEDEEVFEHDGRLIGPQGETGGSASLASAKLDLERMEVYDTMVCWTAWTKYGDPPQQIEAGPIYRNELEEAL